MLIGYCRPHAYEKKEKAKVSRFPTTMITVTGSIERESVGNVRHCPTPRRHLYLENLSEEKGSSEKWKEGPTPNLPKNGKIVLCGTTSCLSSFSVCRLTLPSQVQQMNQQKSLKSYHPMFRIRRGHRKVD